MIHMLILTSWIHQNIINKHNYEHIKVFSNTLFVKSINAARAFVNPNEITKKLIMTITGLKIFL